MFAANLMLLLAIIAWIGQGCVENNRPISVYRFPRRALTLCTQLCMGIQPGARFPARSADPLPATLYGHFTRRYIEIGLLRTTTRTGSGHGLPSE